MPENGEQEPTFQERLDTATEELSQIGEERAYDPDTLLTRHTGLIALVDEGLKTKEIDETESIALKLSASGTAKAIAKQKGDGAAEGIFKSFESTFRVMRGLEKKKGSSGQRKPRKQKPAKTSAAKSGKPKSKQDT